MKTNRPLFSERNVCAALLCVCSVLVLGLRPSALSIAHGSSKSAKLTNPQYGNRSDGVSNWYMGPNGQIQLMNQGQVCWLMINDSNPSFTAAQMTTDQSEFIYSGSWQNQVNIELRAKSDSTANALRMVHTLRNNSNASQNVKVTLYTNLYRMRGGTLLTSKGKSASGKLAKGELGMVIIPSQQHGGLQPLLFHTGSVAKKNAPSIVYNRNDFRLNYQIQIPKGKAVSLVHFVAQRNVGSSPGGKELTKIFRAFRSSKFLRDLPKEIRKSLINGGGGGWSTGGLLSVSEELRAEAGKSDLLVLGEDSSLPGTLSCRSLTLESRYGKTEVPLEQVAALVGPLFSAGSPGLYLRDGQRLYGRIQAEELRFSMNTGLVAELKVHQLDRVVMGTKNEKNDSLNRDVLITLGNGDRVRVNCPPSAELTLATRWGQREVPLHAIQSLAPIEEEAIGHWVTLSDRSRVRAFLTGESLSFQSPLFGAIEVEPSQLIGISQAVSPTEGDLDPPTLTKPHVVLAGGSLLMGRIDLDTVDFMSTGGVLPIPPSQIKELISELDGRVPDIGEPVVLAAEVWGGGEIRGELKQSVLPIRTEFGVFRVSVLDLMEAHVPTPHVPDSLRRQISDLIRKLGDPSWSVREDATQQLSSLGEVAATAIADSLGQARDPEVRRRLEKLLQEINGG